jgi:hypothetical protein
MTTLSFIPIAPLAFGPLIALPAMALAVVVGGVMFAVWLVVRIIEMVIRLFSMICRGFARVVIGMPAPAAVPGVWVRCPRPGCGNANPPEARFCARCGIRQREAFRRTMPPMMHAMPARDAMS